MLDSAGLNNAGLPDNKESEIANQINDTLHAGIQKITTTQYAGHIFNDGFLDVYIYVRDPKKVAHYLQGQMDKSELLRKINFQIKKDPDWNMTTDFFDVGK